MKRAIVLLTIIGAALSVNNAEARVRTVKQSTMSFKALPCTQLCGYGNLAEGDDYACNDPYIEGTYADRVVRAPRTANFMIFAATPEIDWDLFVCRSGKVLKYSAIGYIDVIGAPEKIGMWVKPGYTYVLRAYNRRDLSDLTAKVTFKSLTF